MSRMAADDEEERINRIKERSQQVLAELDVRAELDRRKKDRGQQLDSLKYTALADPVEIKPVIPDLRSRLSRANFD